MELLIVVAIIAILAAIAIPNFLEAQTRSKVARVKSDLRSLAVAEEAYMVDWNTFTFGQGGSSGTFPIVWQGFRLLTSPVAYITSIPMDPFGMSRIGSTWTPPMYEFGTGAAGIAAAPRNFTDWANSQAYPCDTFMLESDGPDRNDNTGGDGPLPSTGSYPMGSWLTEPVEDLLAGIYDPTNGTISGGEILRMGGVVPPGGNLPLFFTAASSAK
ncbi:MAG: hypothetical protein N3D11_13220 [Candidatus Sumerlaeia bacterium]|nr:hypothetical protein [Candidatus Sumerlaeia bacterium]